MKRYILGVDQGTSGVSALLFDEAWQPCAHGYHEIRQIYPQSGWVEHDAEDIWDAVCHAVKQALDESGISPSQIAAVGLDHEGESAMLWDKMTGRPLSNTIVWQDRRTDAMAEAYAAEYGELVRERSGLTVDSYFSALKLRWLLSQTEVPTERILAGNMDAWLLWKMTNGAAHCTDLSTASRTMLLNLKAEAWDEELCGIFGIPREILPTICDSASIFGTTDPAAFCGIAAPVCGVINDQQAALFGQACFAPGMMKTTYGTGAFLLMNTGDSPILSSRGLVTTVGWRVHGKTAYALDGGVHTAGAATRWLRDGLGIIRSAQETEAMARSVKSSDGVYFVPAFSGLAAPYCDPRARGTMLGITSGTAKEHIVRATLESTAYQVYDLVRLTEAEAHLPITVMRCDGGAVTNSFLMQFQADLLGIPLQIPTVVETTSLGTAFLAAIGCGIHGNIEELTPFLTIDRCYEPQMSNDERESLLHGWHRAVERAQYWVE